MRFKNPIFSVRHWGGAVAIASAILCAAGSASVAQEVVGGMTPWERPASAPPRSTKVNHDQAWYQRALTGVSQPYPQSLLFLDTQGEWYTPFTRPGMVDYYDIRGWHRISR